VLASIDAKIAAIKKNEHEPMTLAVDVPMFWQSRERRHEMPAP
jgi:hypothetical protein